MRKKVIMESMTLTLQVDDASLMPSLKRVLRSIEGVHIVPAKRKRKSGIEQALEDEAAGRVTEWTGDIDEMFDQILGKEWRTQ
ncbi:MAG: hypothetical protein II793_06050 [Bacteroidales bacterium]|nr:hypothetical protein [Bacteroidales bacterium]